MWYENNNNEIVLSTRVRLARNVAQYPFPGKMSDEERKSIVKGVKEKLKEAGFTVEEYNEDNDLRWRMMEEQGMMTEDFLTGQDTIPGVLGTLPVGGISVLCPAEDHLRIQSVLAGDQARSAFENASKTEQLLDQRFEFAYSKELGYLTACPTNLGTGMKVSALLFLPGLTLNRLIPDLSSRLNAGGMTLRDFSGENTGKTGYLYLLSNSVTLGLTEEDILNRFETIVGQVKESEEQALKRISGNSMHEITDRSLRSLGILTYAHMLTPEECRNHLVSLKFGINCGCVHGITTETVNRLLFTTGEMASAYRLKPEERDSELTAKIQLAEYVKKELKGKKD